VGRASRRTRSVLHRNRPGPPVDVGERRDRDRACIAPAVSTRETPRKKPWLRAGRTGRGVHDLERRATFGELYGVGVDDYVDPRVQCDASAVHIRGYYFPWGTKRIPYGAIKGVRSVDITTLTGRARIWGTANPGYWANFDPQRPRKKVALIVDLGKAVKPFLTPDDPDAAEKVIRERSQLGPGTEPRRSGPLI